MTRCYMHFWEMLLLLKFLVSVWFKSGFDTPYIPPLRVNWPTQQTRTVKQCVTAHECFINWFYHFNSLWLSVWKECDQLVSLILFVHCFEISLFISHFIHHCLQIWRPMIVYYCFPNINIVLIITIITQHDSTSAQRRIKPLHVLFACLFFLL